MNQSIRQIIHFNQGAANLNITRETKVSSGRDARRMLGAGGGKSHVLTAEELEQCQKYAKVDLLRALRERARADNNLRTFERSFYKKIKSATEAFNFEVSGSVDGFGSVRFGSARFGSREIAPPCCGIRMAGSDMAPSQGAGTQFDADHVRRACGRAGRGCPLRV